MAAKFAKLPELLAAGRSAGRVTATTPIARSLIPVGVEASERVSQAECSSCLAG